MSKPIQLAIEDLKIKLNKEVANAINESGLPMCCVNPILKEIYERCITIEKQQLEAVKENYIKEQEDVKPQDVE